MTVDLLALAGWVAAVGAAAVAFAARRMTVQLCERIALASHELRGGIGAARLGLSAPRSRLTPSRLRAVELELDRAAVALDELDDRTSPRLVGPVDVHDLLSDCVEAARAAAEVRGVELRLSAAPRQAVVLGDRIRLAQATTNLIANAIEHGGGVVDVRGSRDGDVVTVEVLDEGPGLPKPVAELTGRRRRARRGRGLGLGIATNIVETHGGRLSAAPSARGARVLIDLPAHESPQRQRRAN